MQDTKEFKEMKDFYNCWIELMTESQHDANQINKELDKQEQDLKEISRDLKESNEELIRTKNDIEELDLQCCCPLYSVSCCANSKNETAFADRSARNSRHDTIRRHKDKLSSLSARFKTASG